MKVIYAPNKKARKYIIRIIDKDTVRLTIPWGGTKKSADKFLKQNLQFIQEKQKEFPDYHFEKNSKYINKFFSVNITDSPYSWKITEKNKTIIIAIPHHCNTENIQEEIKKAILIKLKKEAKIYLIKRTFELALKHEFKINTVKINSAKTRWGSCSFNNNINLSAYLLLLPLQLIDYIILHELCHTVEKNHSASFYNLLEKVSKDYNQTLRKEIKKYSPQILPYYFKKM